MLTRVRKLLTHRSVQIALTLWALADIAVALLPRGTLDQAGVTATGIAIGANVNLVAVFVLIGVTYALTRRRTVPDLAARAPEQRVAAREVGGLLAYGIAAQLGGALLGRFLGGHPISFHLAGTLYGHQHVTPYEAYTWAVYNFVCYALLPYLYFRRHYSATNLNLRSSNRRNDFLVILVVMIIESLNELGGLSSAILSLSPGQLLVGAPVTFVLYLFGSALPTMIFIYAILLPRYLKLTRSVPATIVLGGLTYALLHFFEAWTVFTSPTATLLSVVLLLLQYFGPGMVKAVLTLRTGNAWVHLWAYHALAPHTLVDTPHVVEILNIGHPA
ncbi:hypothetical protein ACGFYU_02340 [Streptomyces sp. NPDC048337]|uniref:hypothetical protein n=1 Tax=Streptomyces sp. NPDC048337 TaxID=3365535 RepID=UPI003721A73F